MRGTYRVSITEMKETMWFPLIVTNIPREYQMLKTDETE